ncbi:MAG: hypothetical protein JST14_14755 [Bacteroidetes bacterium]|nr:hypothetical protein [Bacteroidota bacterium]
MKHKKIPAKVQKATPKARVHRELDGLEVSINSFGEIQSSMNIEKINEFLNEKVEDKKLAERQDYDDLKKGRKKK